MLVGAAAEKKLHCLPFSPMSWLKGYNDNEAYPVRMDTALMDLAGLGLGPRTLNIFRRAGYTKVRDLINDNQQEAAVRAAALAIAEDAGTAVNGYWRLAASRCVDIIRRIRNPDFSQVIPEPFICPLTNEMFIDPFISRITELTYEREDILARGTYPESGQPVNHGDLVPNIALRNAIAYYNANLRRLSIRYKI